MWGEEWRGASMQGVSEREREKQTETGRERDPSQEPTSGPFRTSGQSG